MSNSKEEDRLSDLPDALLHSILSLVPTLDAVRMSVLSKRWRNMWYSLPVLRFLDIDCHLNSSRIKPRTHSGFVSKCLKLREIDMLSPTGIVGITKFKLSIFHPDHEVDCWLNLVAKSRIKVLDIYVYLSYPMAIYALSSDVFRVRTLVRLKLENISLDDTIPCTDLPSLVSLSLKAVVMVDQTLHDLLLGCTALEKLRLYYCKGLLTPRVSSSSLRFLDIVQHFSHHVFHVEAANLECVKFQGVGYPVFMSLNPLSCGALRNIAFTAVYLDKKWLEDIIPRLACLESLSLDSCKLKHAKIYSPQLKHLTMVNVESGFTTIDAPNLVCFSFEGYPRPDIALNVPNLQKALIVPCRLCKVFKTPLPVLEHLKVRTSDLFSSDCELMASLFWSIPSLEIVSLEN